MIALEKNTFLKEHLDYSDPEIIKALTEAVDAEDKIIIAITSKLYDKIEEKYEKIDFGSISRSRGDITKIEKFESMNECIEIIRRLVVEYKQDTYPVDVVATAITNVKKRTSTFKKAFVMGAKVPMMLYNTIGLAIVESVSFLISTCVEYVKVPNSETFQMALDTVAYSNTTRNLLFNTLADFNQACVNTEFDSTLEVCMKQAKIRMESTTVDVMQDNPFLNPEDIESDDKEVVVHDNDEEKKKEEEEVVPEDALKESDINIGTGASILARAAYFVARLLIPLIRNITYFFYSRKQKKSDYYTAQAELLQMNAMQLQYNTSIDEEKRKKVFEKQMAIVDKYRERANRYSIDYSMAKKSTEKMINDDTRKMKASDIIDPNQSTADAAASVLF